MEMKSSGCHRVTVTTHPLAAGGGGGVLLVVTLLVPLCVSAVVARPSLTTILPQVQRQALDGRSSSSDISYTSSSCALTSCTYASYTLVWTHRRPFLP